MRMRRIERLEKTGIGNETNWNGSFILAWEMNEWLVWLVSVWVGLVGVTCSFPFGFFVSSCYAFALGGVSLGVLCGEDGLEKIGSWGRGGS